MSEYQYYEFHAIDKPLTEKDMEALRDLSIRALEKIIHRNVFELTKEK